MFTLYDRLIYAINHCDETDEWKKETKRLLQDWKMED